MNFDAGAGIDLSSLCIVQGKVCWDLYIDCLVVSSDGNVLDALGAAIKVFPLISYACTLPNFSTADSLDCSIVKYDKNFKAKTFVNQFYGAIELHFMCIFKQY